MQYADEHRCTGEHKGEVHRHHRRETTGTTARGYHRGIHRHHRGVGV